jgi:phosphoserine phosphatase
VSARFASVVLDVDSTLSGIEGIDWLAARRGPDMAARIAALTDEAMRGLRPLESVYGARLEAIRPSRDDIAALALAYRSELAVDADRVIRELRRAGVHVVVVSGGLRPAIAPMAASLGVDDADLHAVGISFDDRGAYRSFEDTSPLATSVGKRLVLERLALARPILAVGDGATDVVMRDVVEQFGAFVGFARRENVVARADLVIESFARLADMVLATG